MEIERLGVHFAVKITCVLPAVFEVIFAFFSRIEAVITIFCGLLGFVFGLISALVCNVVSRFIGGFGIEMEPADAWKPGNCLVCGPVGRGSGGL